VSIELAICGASFGYWLNRKKLREVRRREGRYLLRTNLTESDPAKLWEYYIQLVAVEEAFKTLKGDLSVRPIFHPHQSHADSNHDPAGTLEDFCVAARSSYASASVPWAASASEGAEAFSFHALSTCKAVL
jgi:hypothetical protein